MATRLTVSGSELSPADVQALTDELTAELNAISGVEAARVESRGAPGARGEVITLGNIALTFLTSGAAVAAINVFKSYFSRQPSLQFDIVDESGKKVSLSGKNLKAEQFDSAIAVLGKSLAKKK